MVQIPTLPPFFDRSKHGRHCHSRAQAASPHIPDANVNAKADAWDFLSPWFEQLKGSLTVTSDGYLQVLYQQPRWIRRGRPNPYDICEWHTREALELLVLVHSVNNRAWVKILKEKCELRFEEEEEEMYRTQAVTRRGKTMTRKHLSSSASTTEKCRCRLVSSLRWTSVTNTHARGRMENPFPLSHFELQAQSGVLGRETADLDDARRGV